VIVVPQLVPTPPDLAARMVEMADLRPGHRVLEPSAGSGALVDATKCLGVHVTAVEINYDATRVLAEKAERVVHADFLNCNGELGTFDRVLINPPFSNNQDIKHVRHAFDKLRDGGRLVAIMSPHWTFANDRASQDFRAWFEERGGTYEELPAGTFKESGTMVNSVLAVIGR